MATRLTLLCGANPARATCGPTVRLQAGRWKIQHDGVNESLFFIMLEASNLNIASAHDFEFDIAEAENVHIDFVTRGKEKYVSIYLEKVA